MRLPRRVLSTAVLGLALSLGWASPGEARKSVYLMRGLMDVSTGLDDLAARLKQRGVTAVVASYTSEAELAARAIRDYKAGKGCPIVLIGHSLGADAAIAMAEDLQKASVPVALVVAFSPASSRSVPGNVSRAVNYYQSNSAWNYVYSRGAGFRGSLRNVNLARQDGVHHFNIEKQASLHAETLRMIASLGDGCPPAKPADGPPKGQ